MLKNNSEHSAISAREIVASAASARPSQILASRRCKSGETKNPNRKYERLYRKIDTEEFRAQIHAIVDKGYYVERPTDYQLMIGLVNYYPGKDTITVGSVRHPEKGLDALFELLEMHRAMTVTV